jgi:hypothetical protein
MTGCLPPPTRHNSAPAPSTLPNELLLACFVLVRRDGAQPPLSPIYNGPYRVLKRSTHFFLLEMGDRTDKVSTLRLKAAQTPATATCPRAATETAGAASTGDLQPTSYNEQLHPLHQHPAARFAKPGR